MSLLLAMLDRIHLLIYLRRFINWLWSVEELVDSRIALILSKVELQIIVYALSSTSIPFNKESEELQFLLYNRLLTKLNELDSRPDK